MATKRGSVGRRKIPMRRIESREALAVSFSKRRHSLFKKAAEFSALCGAFTAAIAFSPGGKPFSFAYPSVAAVVDRFLEPDRTWPDPAGVAGSDALRHQMQEEAEAAGEPPRRAWWEEPIDGLAFEELERMQAMLEELSRAVSARADDVACARMVRGI